MTGIGQILADIERPGALDRVERRPAPLPGRSPVSRFRVAGPAGTPERHPGRCVVKAALLAFVFSITAPVHVTVAAFGTRVCVPVPWLVLAAEVLSGTEPAPVQNGSGRRVVVFGGNGT